MATRQFTNGMRYSVVGRYMVGSEVTAYHIVGEDGSQHKVTKEQLILLADRGLMLNCRIQMYNGKPLLRGKGVNLGELPVFDEKSGKLKRMDTVPAVRPKGKESSNVLGQIYIVGRITQGTSVVQYITRDNGGVERILSRQKVLELAQRKLIANATVQKYNGRLLLRGVGINLERLPSIPIESLHGN